MIKNVIRAILPLFGFGWEYSVKNHEVKYRDRKIKMKLQYRKNKYNGREQKRTNFPLCNGFDYNHWFDV